VNRLHSLLAALLVVAVVLAAFYSLRRTAPESANGLPILTVATAPYQDLAMLVNAEPLGFAKKHGLQLKLITMAWEDILPTVGSYGKTVDVGFGSYAEYITKYSKINNNSSDPILFIQPLYIYDGGGFIAMRSDIPLFSEADLSSPEKLALLKTYRIGAQKESLYDMMLYELASRGGIKPSELHVVDIPMNDSLLALEAKSLDLSSAGLTQVTEARKQGGRLVISMQDAHFADITGFICRKSTLDARKADIENLILTWFDCVNYVMSDLKANSGNSLRYLAANAATQYTYEQYADALSQEYLPRSLSDLQAEVLKPGSKFDYLRIGNSMNDYLVSHGVISAPTPLPTPLLPDTP